MDTVSDEVRSRKRGASTSSENSASDDSDAAIATVLMKIKSGVKLASGQANLINSMYDASGLINVIDIISGLLSQLINKKGKLIVPSRKKHRGSEPEKPRAVTADAATETPEWSIPIAESSTSTPTRRTTDKGKQPKANRNKTRKLDHRTPIYDRNTTQPSTRPGTGSTNTQDSSGQASSGKTQPDPGPTNTAATTTNQETPADDFTVVTKKKPTKTDVITRKKANNPGKTIPPEPSSAKKISRKPAAVLVKVGEGSTYADTVRKVRGLDVDFTALGTKVTSMRKTTNGDLIVELTKSKKSLSAADTIREKITEYMPDAQVRCLGQTSAVEILDLDEVTTKEEVHMAILKSVNADNKDTDVKITGLWSTKGGRQMATASVPSTMASKLTHIRIGWLQCRVRPRRAEPLRCYRCHGFGHGTRQCSGPDMTGRCRRCGEPGHLEKSCTAGEDRCVACDRIGATRAAHRPGSGACSARRAALQVTAPKPL